MSFLNATRRGDTIGRTATFGEEMDISRIDVNAATVAGEPAKGTTREKTGTAGGKKNKKKEERKANGSSSGGHGLA